MEFDFEILSFRYLLMIMMNVQNNNHDKDSKQ